jgi:hypothetical protein
MTKGILSASREIFLSLCHDAEFTILPAINYLNVL